MRSRVLLVSAFVVVGGLVACGGDAPQPAHPTPAASSSTSAPVATTSVAAPDASAAASAAHDAAAKAETERFARLRDRLVDETFAFDPSFAREIGLHEYDGKLADFSRAALDRSLAASDKAIVDLDAIDAALLSPDDALDRAILRRSAAIEHFVHVSRDASRKLPLMYEDIFDVEGYVDRAYAPLEVRLTKLVEHEEQALTQVAHIRENLVLPISRPIAIVSAKIFGGFGDYLRKDVVKTFAGVGDKALQARFKKSNDALAKEADGIARWIEKEVIPKSDDSFRLGADRYRELLKVQEGLTISIEEMRAIGEADLARNKAAYEVLIKSTKLTPTPAKSELALARSIVADARRFVVDKKLVTLATDDDAEVVETPPFKRWNAAAIDMTGPFDHFRVAHYEITLPDPKWPAAEQAAYVLPLGTLVATSVHEVYPGHFVQGRWIERAPTKVQKIFSAYSFSEGWAHYSEQLMVEEGFYADKPEIKLGQVTDALLRDCRFLGSIALHVDGKSVDEVAKRFIDDCHQDKATAREQAVRGTFDPGYFAYTLGKLQILELRERAKKVLGDAFSLQRFHDAVLSHGTPPLALIKERVLKDLGAPSP